MWEHKFCPFHFGGVGKRVVLLMNAQYYITFLERQLLPAVVSSLQEKWELQKSQTVVWNVLAMPGGAAPPATPALAL